MIASLRGTLLEQSGASCVIEAGGVGYLVQVSNHTVARLPARGEEVFLRTRQIVREDAHLLFGFADPEELKLFDLLLTVSGVGPKVALAVLSGMRPAQLARTIREEKIATLVSIPGIGRKTAERIVVELRDKLEVPAAPVREGGVLPRSAQAEDAVAALINLGYTAAQSQDTVRRVSEAEDGLSLEDLVRRSLATLGKSTVGAR